MMRERVNRVSGVAPILMSAAALAIVGFVVLTGWQRHLPDEGAAAHIFQILVVAQAPLIMMFLGTADWRRTRRPLGVIAVQGGARTGSGSGGAVPPLTKRMSRLA